MPAGSLRRSKGAEGGAVLPARHTLELQHDQQNIRHYRDVLLAFGGLPEQPGKLTPAEFRAVCVSRQGSGHRRAFRASCRQG
jgi:hypothetical protein